MSIVVVLLKLLFYSFRRRRRRSGSEKNLSWIFFEWKVGATFGWVRNSTDLLLTILYSRSNETEYGVSQSERHQRVTEQKHFFQKSCANSIRAARNESLGSVIAIVQHSCWALEPR